MRISCSRCHAAYEVPDEKLQRAAVKIRCSQCGHLFVARRRSPEEEISAVSPQASERPDARVEDLDFASFQPQGAAVAEEAPAPTSSASPDLAVSEPPPGDFDLNSFESEAATEEGPARLSADSSEAPLDDFDLSSFPVEGEGAMEEGPAPPSGDSSETTHDTASPLDDFDLNSFELDTEATSGEPGTPAASGSASPESSLDDFDLSNFGLDPEPALADSGAPSADAGGAAGSDATSELGLDEFDLSGFGMEGEAPSGAQETSASAEGPNPAAPGKDDALPDLDSLNFDDLEIPALGELDLGDFDAPGGFEEPPETARFEAPAAPSLTPEREPLERVRPDELVAAPAGLKEVPVQGLAEDIPQLDLQRGRRPEAKPTKSRLLARDRKHSPLVWFVVLVAAATLGYTGYNIFRHPEAFTFLNPGKLLEYWHSGERETKLAVETKGYYQSFRGGRRAFVIRGEVTNQSEKAQGLIRVKGALFGEQGAQLSVLEAYCGNVLNDRELASLPRETIEARLQNQVGAALSNVDIAPGGKVPFMLVFVPPPDGVEKYKVTASAARAGSPQ